MNYKKSNKLEECINNNWKNKHNKLKEEKHNRNKNKDYMIKNCKRKCKCNVKNNKVKS